MISRRSRNHAALALFKGEVSSLFKAPRSLNDPVICKFSSLKKWNSGELRRKSSTRRNGVM